MKMSDNHNNNVNHNNNYWKSKILDHAPAKPHRLTQVNPHPRTQIDPHLPTPRYSRCGFNLKAEFPHSHIRVDTLRPADHPVKQDRALSLVTETILTHKHACEILFA